MTGAPLQCLTINPLHKAEIINLLTKVVNLSHFEF